LCKNPPRQCQRLLSFSELNSDNLGRKRNVIDINIIHFLPLHGCYFHLVGKMQLSREKTSNIWT
jgi:hypothetical protein